jgi:hypothetical protein
MRKSSQRRCTATIFGITASNRAKALDAALNFGQAIFARR